MKLICVLKWKKNGQNLISILKNYFDRFPIYYFLTPSGYFLFNFAFLGDTRITPKIIKLTELQTHGE